MKNQMMRKLLKRTAAILLAQALVVAGVCLTENGSAVQASQTTENTESIYKEQLEVSHYIQGEKRTAPKPTKDGYRDWIFAGWFTDEACSTAIAKDTVSGVYYAKFVPAELLSVRCQTLKDTDAAARNSKLRVVSTVDNLNYNRVGFAFKMGDKKSFEFDTTTVYQRIEEVAGGVSFDYVPKDFHPLAGYFTTVTLINISNEDFQTGFLISPYWETRDGTVVYGVSRYARIEDSYRNIVNVPVRLYTDQEAAAGYLEVGYDSSIYEYVGCDTGTVYEEMEAANSDGKVRCVGNVADIAGNAKADGMYINLRFQVMAGESIPPAGSVFSVLEERFVDREENAVGLAVSDVIYKKLTKGSGAGN